MITPVSGARCAARCTLHTACSMLLVSHVARRMPGMLHWNTLPVASGKDSASRAHCLSDANAADGAPHPTDPVAVRLHGRGTACAVDGAGRRSESGMKALPLPTPGDAPCVPCCAGAHGLLSPRLRVPVRGVGMLGTLLKRDWASCKREWACHSMSGNGHATP